MMKVNHNLYINSIRHLRDIRFLGGLHFLGLCFLGGLRFLGLCFLGVFVFGS